MKILLRSLSIAVLVFTAAVVFFIATEQGSRSLFSILQQVFPVEIDYGSGSLSDRLYLKRFHFEVDSLALELTDVVAEIEPVCLLRMAVCLRNFEAKNLDIALLDGSVSREKADAKAGRKSAAKVIIFPGILEIDSLDLTALRVHWANGEWRQASTHGRVRISGSVVEVFSAVITEPRLKLQETASDGASDSVLTVLPVIDLPFELRVDALQLIRPSWDFYGTEQRQDNITLQGRWLNRALTMTKLNIDSHELGEFALHGDLTFEADWPIHAAATIVLAQPSLWPQILGQRVTLSARGDLASLALQLTADGDITMSVEAQVNTLRSELPFSAMLSATSATNMRLADIDGVPDLISDFALEFPFTASANGTLASQQFELQATASGQGYESLAVMVEGDYESQVLLLRQLTIRDEATQSALQGSGEVVMAEAGAIEWSIALRSDGVSLPSVVESVHGRLAGSLQLSGQMQGQRWQFNLRDVQLHGTINDLPASVAGFAGLSSELRLMSSDLQAQFNGAKASLRAAGSSDTASYINVSIDDIGLWQSGSRGYAQLQASLSSDAQYLQLSGDLDDVFWRGLTANKGSLVGEYRLSGRQPFNLDVALEDVVISNAEIESVLFAAHGDGTQQSASIVSSGDLAAELGLTGSRIGGLWQGVLTSTKMQTPLGAWRLSEPVTLAWSESTQQLSVGAHCWLSQYASVCPDDWLVGARGGGGVEISADIKLFADLLDSGVGAEGAMTFDADASWELDGDIIASGHSTLRGVMFTRELGKGSNATFGWDAGEANFEYANQNLKLNGGLQQDGHEVASLKLKLPADSDDEVAGSVRFDGLQLATFTPLIPALDTLFGEVTGELALSGTRGQLVGHGSLALADGRMVMANNPTQLERLNLTFNVLGDGAKVQGGGLLGGGEITMSGELKTHPTLTMALAVEGEKNTILYPPSAEIQVSESLRLRLASDRLAIDGDITVHNGSVKLGDESQNSVAISSSVVEVDYKGNVLRQELPFKTSMNLKIKIKNKLDITGSGFQATLGGDLNVKQRPRPSTAAVRQFTHYRG